jgi:hypothetical protein
MPRQVQLVDIGDHSRGEIHEIQNGADALAAAAVGIDHQDA